jgi:nitrogen fixation/metabolism regulation signal transduction histidine kinase
MALLKTNSLEGYIQAKLALLCLLVLLLGGYIAWLLAVKWQWIVVIELLLFSVCFWYVLSVKQQVMRSFTRALLHLDAITQEDYNQFGKSAFSHGKVKEFHQQLKALSEKLQSQKSHYDQHAFLVYQLISQLDTPVLVFNEKQQLTLGNEAFYHLFKQPWQMYRHATADLLGLHYGSDGWQFIEQAKQKRWQIRHSEFVDDGENHQLLVFIDIEPALRESQLNAWQQIIRVLSHEIRNSLTPVSSMAETLADKATNERDKMVLGVITERCLHLQSFVNRYSSISQQIQIHCQWLTIKHVIKSVSGLFTGVNIAITNMETSVDEFWADGEFIEQIFINLFKNSQEAGASEITVNLALQEQFYVIEITDNGHGFSNLNNLFVPLYSTKPQGQGIGLSFCRNIIEQHHGVMELHNNDENNSAQQGVTVMIVLPKPSKNIG